MLFFAVTPDPATAARITALATLLRRRLGLAERPVAADRLHVTLGGVGLYNRFSPAQLGRVLQAASSVRSPPFAVSFDRFASFGAGENRPLVLLGEEGTTGLRRLAEAVGRPFGRPDWADAVPHMTMIRGHGPVHEEFLPTPIAWTTAEFVLIHRLRRRDRFEHRPLGRWPLA